MKKKILFLITSICSCFYKKCAVKNSIYVLNRTKIIGNNCIKMTDSYMSRLQVHLEGENNQILNLGSTIIRGELRVVGNNNTIEIKKGCYLANIRIVVRGNNCHVIVGNDVTCGSAFIASMGQNNEVVIGDDCMLSENIDIWATDSHAIYDENKQLMNPSKSIHIGNHVWLGKGCSVLKGVTIGNGAIIGMRAVVTKDIEQYSLNVGNPAKEIKKKISWKRGFIEQ